MNERARRHALLAGGNGMTGPSHVGQPTVQDPGMRLDRGPAWALAALGSGPDPIGRAWLAVALSHKSWLYENGPLTGPNVTLLGAFSQLGNDVLGVELVVHLQHVEPQAGLQRRHEVLSLRMQVVQRLVSDSDMALWARLGTGEAVQAAQFTGTGRGSAALQSVALQILGWWSLFGDPDALRAAVDAAARSVLAGGGGDLVDAKTHVQELYPRLSPVYSYDAAGPDHNRTFTACVQLADGRTGAGSGPSKKAAGKAAARDLLAKYAPERLEPAPDTAADERTKAVHRVGRQDTERYRPLALSFGCRTAENFAVAMTHRSWTYEQHKVDLDAGSCTLLAHSGRLVFDLLVNRIRLRAMLQSNLSPELEQAVLGSPPDADMAGFLDLLEATDLVRLGLGQRQVGLSTEIAASCVQALFGAALLEHRQAWRIEQALPPILVAAIRDLAGASAFDSYTRLHRELAKIGLVAEEASVVGLGPDHSKVHEVTLVLSGDAGTATVRGEASSKRQARKAAADNAFGALGLLEGHPDAVAPDDATARLLLKSQIRALSARGSWARWLSQGRLGSGHLATGHHDDFRAWAAAAVKCLGGWEPTASDEQAIRAFFDFARDAEPRPLFTAALVRLNADLEGLTAADAVDVAALGRARESLRALSAAHAVQLAAGDRRAIADVVDDWIVLNRRFLNVSLLGATDAVLSAASAAGLARVLVEAAEDLRQDGGAQRSVKLEMSDDPAGCRIIVIADSPWADAVAYSDCVGLIRESAPGLIVERLDPTTLVATAPAAGDDNWLAVSAATSARDDMYDRELARLLHDLKNQLTAVSVAQAQPAGSRTERLTRDLAISQHLDAAGALGARLRAARLDLGGHDVLGEVVVDRFLRTYSADLLRALPGEVRLMPPSGQTGVTASLSASALAAALDNLVNNALEAMPAGGQILIDAVATDDAVIVEVTDSGPGVPLIVLKALERDEVAPSTKRQGSGLGLASVQRLLHRAGGRLDWSATTSGHSWQVIVPIASASAA